jgi:glycopeptide antibiotics resistance protein
MTKRNLIFSTFLIYLAFVIYGSLVPLNFRYLPLDQAWSNFHNILNIKLGVASRVDLVTNILLFIPLSFLWLGTLWSTNNLGLKLGASALVLICCLCLSIGIEFSQLFFPPRTASQTDMLAETLGALIGILLWWWKGTVTVKWIEQFFNQHESTAGRLLWIYLAILFGYNILPLDLTISPIELHDKWRQGKIILIPFTGLPSGAAEFAYNLFTDIVIWIPVTFLFILSGKRRPMQAWIWTVTAAIILEFAQLLVYSRVTDFTDIISACLGAGIGVIAASQFRSHGTSPSQQPLNNRLLLWIAASLVYSLLLCAIFWYPYDFHLDSNFLRQRISGFYQVPLVSYFYSTEFRAITEVIHKMGFFMPLGGLLAFTSMQISHLRLRTFFTLLALAIIAGMAFVIELGQVGLPSKYPGNTDLALEALGGIIGFFGFKFVFHNLQLNQHSLKKRVTK